MMKGCDASGHERCLPTSRSAKSFKQAGVYCFYWGTGERSLRSCFRQVDRKSGNLVMIMGALVHVLLSKLVVNYLHHSELMEGHVLVSF